eukprot:g35326.t1
MCCCGDSSPCCSGLTAPVLLRAHSPRAAPASQPPCCSRAHSPRAAPGLTACGILGLTGHACGLQGPRPYCPCWFRHGTRLVLSSARHN